MVKKDNDTFQCEICQLHFKEEHLAYSCEAWCKENKSCNWEITKQSVENG